MPAEGSCTDDVADELTENELNAIILARAIEDTFKSPVFLINTVYLL